MLRAFQGDAGDCAVSADPRRGSGDDERGFAGVVRGLVHHAAPQLEVGAGVLTRDREQGKFCRQGVLNQNRELEGIGCVQVGRGLGERLFERRFAVGQVALQELAGASENGAPLARGRDGI